MDARLLVRCTNAALVAVVGMAGGHLLMPARPSASTAGRIAFVASVALAGGLAGWRERGAAREDGGRVAGPTAAWLAAGAGAALFLAALAWWLVHG